MRVIAGSKKGQRLKAVPGKRTRPTTDKVKESIFNVLGSPAFFGGIGLDLYAGTGGLGIEALSRGLDKVIFVDDDHQAIQTVIHNLRALHLDKKAEVYRNHASRALTQLSKKNIQFTLMFIDPPYSKQQIAKELLYIDENNLLVDGGMVVIETDKNVTLPSQSGEIRLIKNKKYGHTTIRIYRRDCIT